MKYFLLKLKKHVTGINLEITISPEGLHLYNIVDLAQKTTDRAPITFLDPIEMT